MQILNKEIMLRESPVLLKLALDKPEALTHFEAASGEWAIVNGALQGLTRENGGGILYSKLSAPGDILMDFTGELVPPCENDLNFVFKTEGWNYQANDAGRGYIGGLNGWYTKKAGLERYPECTPAAQTASFKIESGVKYHIQTGCIDGQVFLFVDGNLIIEMNDPQYNDFASLGRFGFGTYCSQARFSNLTVYRPKWKTDVLKYTPVF